MYPTKEEILAETILHKKSLIHNLIEWKKDCRWKTLSKQEKIEALLLLLMILKKQHKTKTKIITADIYCYLPAKDLIIIDQNNPSIISTLHEFAHSIDKNHQQTNHQAEIFACRWSVQLFSKAFPASYKKLNWNGHMLKKSL